MKRAWPFVVLAFAACGCVRSVADRGTGWWRVSSDHVRLSTDVDRTRAITAGWAFEDLYRALDHVFPSCAAPPITERVEVTMFAHGEEYDALAPQHTSGFFRPAAGGIVATDAAIVVRGTRRVYGISGAPLEVSGLFTQVFTHELTHRFVARCYPEAPSWLHEGFARYFETLRVGGDDVTVGIAPYHFSAMGSAAGSFRSTGIDIRLIGRDHVRPPSALFGLAPAAFYAESDVDENYAGAWAFVHVAMLGPDPDLRDRFARYLTELPSGRIDPRRTDSPLAGLPLDDIVARHLSGDLLERRVSYQPPMLADPGAVALDPADAHVLLAQLIRTSHPGDGTSARDDLRQHIALAAAQRSTQAIASLLDLEAGFADPTIGKPALLATLAAEHPDDLDVLSTRAQFEVSRRAPTNEARMLLDRLSARSDDLRAIDLARAAALTEVLREPIVGLDLASRSVALSPSNTIAHATLARLLSTHDRRREAARELELAWITAGHAAPPSAPTVDASDAMDDERTDESGAPPTTTALATTATGDAPLARFEGAATATQRASTIDPHCIGFVGAPIALIDVPADIGPLVVRTHGGLVDAVLLLEDASHQVRCDDDSGGGQSSAVLATFPPGPLVIRVGSFRRASREQAFAVTIDRPRASFDPRLATFACGLTSPDYGTLDIGAPVVLGRHRAVSPPDGMLADPIRDESWVPAMDAFVGQRAIVTALWRVDGAGCSVVSVDIDDGHWLWRVRDMHAP